MKPIRMMAAAFGVALATYGSIAFAADDRFSLELSYGTLDGPGEGLIGPRDRRVRDIESALTRSIRLSWRIDDRWQLRGGYSRTAARYANTESVGCPLDGGSALLGSLCLSLDERSAGTYVDHIGDHELSVVRRWPISNSLSLEGELGVVHARWTSEADREARLLASCLSIESLSSTQPPFPVPGCSSIARTATETAPTGAVRLTAVDLDGWGLVVGAHYRRYRHRIYRSDVFDRFEDANCVDVVSCGRIANASLRYVARIPRSSWVWYSVRLGKQVSDEVEVFGEWVGGGTRDWDGGQVGVVLRF